MPRMQMRRRHSIEVLATWMISLSAAIVRGGFVLPGGGCLSLTFSGADDGSFAVW